MMTLLANFVENLKDELLMFDGVEKVEDSPYAFDEDTEGLDVYTEDGSKFEITIAKAPK